MSLTLGLEGWTSDARRRSPSGVFIVVRTDPPSSSQTPGRLGFPPSTSTPDPPNAPDAPIGEPATVSTSLPTVLEPTRSGPFRSATAARPTTRAIPAEPARAAPPHPPRVRPGFQTGRGPLSPPRRSAAQRARGREMPPRSWPRSGAGSTSGPRWSPRPSRMRGRGEGRGGDARADRRTGSGPGDLRRSRLEIAVYWPPWHGLTRQMALVACPPRPPAAERGSTRNPGPISTHRRRPSRPSPQFVRTQAPSSGMIRPLPLDKPLLLWPHRDDPGVVVDRAEAGRGTGVGACGDDVRLVEVDRMHARGQRGAHDGIPLEEDCGDRSV